MSAARPAFTFVELLIVLAIIVLIFGMSMGSTKWLDAEEAVRSSAEQFASFCAQTRARAVAQQRPFAIAINLQNDPDGSGAVLNNRTGGHWYRAIGPSTWSFKGGARILTATPTAESIYYSTSLTSDCATFVDLVEKLKSTWIGPPVVLPPGKVRFLALGDTDEGARVPGDANGGYGYTSTYPRPWFGYYDPVRQTLYPWGGYNPELHAAEPWRSFSGTYAAPAYSGFFYQGSGPALGSCRHGDDRLYDNDWNGDKDTTDTSAVCGPETGYALWRSGGPRPLVSGDWQDFTIIFLPDGRIFVPPFKTNRKRFYTGQYSCTANNTVLGGSTLPGLGNGVLDTTRPWGTYRGYSSNLDPMGWGANRKHVYNNCYSWMGAYEDGRQQLVEAAEVTHFTAHTGAWRITFAPDARSDGNRFPTVREALASISPMYRVELSQEGGIRTFRVRNQNDDAWLTAQPGLAPWPPTPSFWTDSAAFATLNENCRFGWPHAAQARDGTALTGVYDWVKPDDLVPVGRPITDTVTPRMLTGKVWWLR